MRSTSRWGASDQPSPVDDFVCLPRLARVRRLAAWRAAGAPADGRHDVRRLRRGGAGVGLADVSVAALTPSSVTVLWLWAPVVIQMALIFGASSISDPGPL